MLRVRTEFTGPTGSPWLSTCYFAESDQAGATAANAAVGTFWSAVDAQMSNQVSWSTEPEVAVMSPGGAISGLLPVTPVTGTGGGTAEMLPLAAQLVVQLRSGFWVNGREIRGRLFVPGITQGANDDGEVLEANRTLTTNAAAALRDAAGCELVIWSRKNLATATVVTVNTWKQFGMLTSRRD